MSDAITLDVLSSSPVQLDVGDADPIAREEIAELATRVTTVEGDVSGLSTRMGAVEGDISTLGTTVDGIDARVEAIEADYVTSEDVMGALGGEAPTLVAGSSRAMLGDPETASWMERTTAADGAALIEAVHGNTLVWNQLVKNGDFSNGKSNWSSVAGSWDVQDGTAVISVTGTYPALSQYVNPNDTSYTSTVSGHKYLAALDCALTSSQLGVRMSCITYDSSNANVGAVYTPYGQTISSSMTRYGGIFTATGAANHFIFNANGCASGDTVKFDNLQLFDLTAMFGSGNEPSTVAEFEALYPLPYYPYDPGSLLSVQMEGVESTSKNLVFKTLYSYSVGPSGVIFYNSTHEFNLACARVFAGETYTARYKSLGSSGDAVVAYFTSEPMESSVSYNNSRQVISSSTGTITVTAPIDGYICVRTPSAYGTPQIEFGSTATDYAPHWHQTRTIPASTYFPQGMRSAGSVCDELRADAAVTRVGAVDLGTLTWSNPATNIFNAMVSNMATSVAYKAKSAAYAYATNNFNLASVDSYADKSISTAGNNYIYVKDTAYSDAAAFKQAMSGVMLHYALATPTVTPIDPPLPLSYRVGAGGTERVMVASGTTSAPPVFATRYPLDPADLAASIAPRESAIAEANHAVGDLIMLGWTLCKVTTAIARGEAITIGTNVTKTSVAAEIAALS